MNTDLWNQLRDMKISRDGDALPFVERMRRENGWSAARAEMIYQEYLRFIYLAVVAGHPVTPCEDVDQAWHLHLCYTRSYWNDLCRSILGRPLHHDPTRGGSAEDIRYRNQYTATLEAYRKHFACEPPEDIWPDPAERFYASKRHVRVDLNQSLVLSRNTVSRVLALVSGSLLLTGCMTVLGDSLGENIIRIILLAIGGLLLVKLVRWMIRNGGGSGGCGGSCGGNSGCGGDSGCGGGCGGD